MEVIYYYNNRSRLAYLQHWGWWLFNRTIFCRRISCLYVGGYTQLAAKLRSFSGAMFNQVNVILDEILRRSCRNRASCKGFSSFLTQSMCRSTWYSPLQEARSMGQLPLSCVRLTLSSSISNSLLLSFQLHKIFLLSKQNVFIDFLKFP